MPPTMTEQELIAALQAGDRDALAVAFERYADGVYRLAMGFLRDDQQADGVVQDTFIKLMKQINAFEGRARLSTWLHRVATNECLGRLRQQKPSLPVEDFLDEDFMPSNFVSWDDIPDTICENGEAARMLQVAIESLSTSLRLVFVLRDVEGFSTQETAHMLDISESAVKVRLHRARLHLREKLADYFQEYIRT